MDNTEQKTADMSSDAVNTLVETSKETKGKNDISEKLKRARTQRDKIALEAKKIELAQKKAAEAERQRKEAKKDREEAEKKLKALKNQNAVILRIAGREQERPAHRRQWAVKGFFELITNFNSEGKQDFSRLCYSLNDTELVYKSLMASIIYNREKDWLGINGTEFRKRIAKEKACFDNDLEEAKRILEMDSNESE